MQAGWILATLSVYEPSAADTFHLLQFFVMGEVAVQLFQETPTSFLQVQLCCGTACQTQSLQVAAGCSLPPLKPMTPQSGAGTAQGQVQQSQQQRTGRAAHHCAARVASGGNSEPCWRDAAPTGNSRGAAGGQAAE